MPIVVLAATSPDTLEGYRALLWVGVGEVVPTVAAAPRARAS